MYSAFLPSFATLVVIDDYNDDDRQIEYNFSSKLNPVKCNRRKDIKQLFWTLYCLMYGDKWVQRPTETEIHYHKVHSTP
jgi:hypothetical protein